jgi:DNA modification methylase
MKDNTIISGDAIPFLASLPDECTDLIIADPPYSLEKDKEFGQGAFFKNREEWLSWCKIWLQHAKRILSPKGNLFVYAIHRNACFLQTYMYEIGLTYRRQIIWFYENGFSRHSNAPACHYEPIIWFAKGGNSIYHVIREPYKSQERLRHPIIKDGKVWTPNPEGRQAGDVWNIPTLAGRRFAAERTAHPTQKPLSLSIRLVKHFSNVDSLVVVPFVGSGSECIAAVQAKRRFIGAEINPAYVEIANKRLLSISTNLFDVGSNESLSQDITSETVPFEPHDPDA